jgi:hypothetical protein
MTYSSVSHDCAVADSRSIVHESVKSGLEKGVADTVDFEASARPGDGYIHITDERAIPPAGRIGETEDLIGSVFVQDGKVRSRACMAR